MFTVTCHPPSSLFFFNDTATTEIYTLSLHDALPISGRRSVRRGQPGGACPRDRNRSRGRCRGPDRCCRSEEHTSELQSRLHLGCRLLLEKKKPSRLAHQQSAQRSLQPCRSDVRGYHD